MTRRRNTDITGWVAEDMLNILDYLSRVKSAADGANGPGYMHEKVWELARVAGRLHRTMSDPSDPDLVDAEPRPPFYRYDPARRFAPEKLRALIMRDAHYYEAGRALYPRDGSAAAAAARRALENAATDLRFGAPPGLTPAQADAVADWLQARAEQAGGAS